MFDIAINVVESIEKGIKPLIGWEKSHEIVKIGADGTPTKRIDVIAENIAINSIEKYCSAVLISEEIGFKKIGEDPPKYLIVLDPIDGTYNALNDLPIYSVSIGLCKIPYYEYGYNDNNLNSARDKSNSNYMDIINRMTINDLELGMVKNIATGDIYYGEVSKGSYILEKHNNWEKRKIRTSNTKNLKDASVGVFAYGLSTNTLDFIKDRRVRRIRIFGSAALEMCYVARGALDAFINVNKTTRLCDIAGGYVILRESGGIITDKDGKPINIKLNVHDRTSLICSNAILHKKFVGIFGNKWFLKPTKFGIISRVDREEAINLAIDVIKYLKSKNIDYLLESELFNILKNNKFLNINKSDCKLMDNIEDISHMLAIGGDGTVLRASKLINGNEIPIIPINMGTVGFLTEFDRDDVFKAIDMVIMGNYEIEKRTNCFCVLKRKINSDKCNEEHKYYNKDIKEYNYKHYYYDKEENNNIIKNNGENDNYCDYTYKYSLNSKNKGEEGREFNNDHGTHCQKILPDALNEVVLITKSPAKMIHFEVYVNGEVVEQVRADGLIISTPTGSTAYSLSAGGPILEPAVDAFIIVPICPFKLFSRPIVVDGNSEIKIKILKKSVLIVIDGNIEGLGKKGDELVFRKSDSYTYFVKGKSFYGKLKKLVEEGN